VSTDVRKFGDANLDGHVNGSDYSKIDFGSFNHLTGWSNGDFNYDGVINGSDYTLIDNAFNTQGESLAASTAPPTTSTAARNRQTDAWFACQSCQRHADRSTARDVMDRGFDAALQFLTLAHRRLPSPIHCDRPASSRHPPMGSKALRLWCLRNKAASHAKHLHGSP